MNRQFVKQAAIEVISRLKKCAVKPIKPVGNSVNLPKAKPPFIKKKPKPKKTNFLDTFNEAKKGRGL